MIQEVNDRRRLRQYVETLRGSLDDPSLSGAAQRAAEAIGGEDDPVRALHDAIPPVEPQLASSGGAVEETPFLARDPALSLIQSSLDLKLREKGFTDTTPVRLGVWDRLKGWVRRVLHPGAFEPTDRNWVIKVGEAMLDRLAKGNHEFNEEPAQHQISDDARIVLVGDWGTGLKRANSIAELIRKEVAKALEQGREAHVVHLGDVYYSGLPEECRTRVLKLWPVTRRQARRGATSWSLNGNHDMYGGGFGYFDCLLADKRFSGQRSSNGETTSFFHLRSPSWDVIGLDTSWDPDVLSLGHRGVLQDPQAEFVKSIAEGSSRKLMLLSHHQLSSVYELDDVTPPTRLYRKLAPLLEADRVTAWFWGHEHRCMGFYADRGVKFPRCVGNGGVPVFVSKGDIPKPGMWEDRGVTDEPGERWARFGFAILDLAGPEIRVCYRDEQGPTREENLS